MNSLEKAANTPSRDLEQTGPKGGSLEEKANSTCSSSHSVEDFPLKWKVISLCLALFLSVGSSFSESTLGPLKATFIRELGITNAKYGAISSATSLVNTSFLPILGGYVLDYYGVGWGSMGCSIAIFIGSVISALGSNSSSFALIIAGRVILGIGSTIIESATSKILAHWFQHRGLAFVYGLDISFGKCVVLAAKASAVPMRDASAFWGWALWIPSIICFVNLLQILLYVWYTNRFLPKWTRIPTGREQTLKSGTSKTAYLPNWRYLLTVPRFFWFIVCSQILQAGTVGGFNGLNTLARSSRSYQSSLPPTLGFFFGKAGHRMLLVSITSLLWILVYCLMAFTTMNALGPMIISSVALAFNAIPFICSIPLLVPDQSQLGMVFGIWKAFNNSGSVIVDVVAGKLQDITPGGGYQHVMAFFITMKSLEVFWGAFYGVIDRKYNGGVLSISENERLERQCLHELDNVPGLQPHRWTTRFGLGLFACMWVCAWTVFFIYSIA